MPYVVMSEYLHQIAKAIGDGIDVERIAKQSGVSVDETRSVLAGDTSAPIRIVQAVLVGLGKAYGMRFSTTVEAEPLDQDAAAILDRLPQGTFPAQ